MEIILMITLLIFSCTRKLLADVTCINVKSYLSASFDDAQTSIGCPTNYHLVSCGFSTLLPNSNSHDGGYIGNDGKCIAQNGIGGTGVYAHARCCNFDFASDVSCIGVLSDEYSGSGDDDGITTSCPSSSYALLTGCSYYTPWKSGDGAYVGNIAPVDIQYYNTKDYPGHNDCTARNGVYGSGVKASLSCCHSPTYDIECVTRYGGANTDSTVECGTGYFMTGCGGYSRYANTNAWYIDDSNICHSRSNSNTATYAVAICCKIVTPDPTETPTRSPTKEPTPAPTRRPTKSPTAEPTPAPTNNPTISPTKTPTTPPTRSPTNKPTKSPTHSPTNRPTRSPTNSPTERPTISPTLKPTHTPTKAPSDDNIIVPTDGFVDGSTTAHTPEPEDTDPDASEQPVPFTGDTKDNSGLIIGLIVALIVVLLCCICVGLLIFGYFMRKRRKMDNQVDHVNGESVDVASNQIQYIEGTSHGSTAGFTTNYTGIKSNPIISNTNNKEKIQLLPDTSDPDDDDDNDDIDIVFADPDGRPTRGLSVDDDVVPK